MSFGRKFSSTLGELPLLESLVLDQMLTVSSTSTSDYNLTLRVNLLNIVPGWWPRSCPEPGRPFSSVQLNSPPVEVSPESFEVVAGRVDARFAPDAARSGFVATALVIPVSCPVVLPGGEESWWTKTKSRRGGSGRITLSLYKRLWE